MTMTDAEWRVEDIRLRREYAAQYAADLEMRRAVELAQERRHDADMAQRREHELAYEARHATSMAWAREKEAAEKARHEQSQAALNRQFDLLMNPPAQPPSPEVVALQKLAEKHTLLAEVVYDHLKRIAP
jgi:hypothetical protein